MTIGVVSEESLSNRLHGMSRENRNPVIGFLGYRYTLIAKRLEGFGRELCPLQFLQQQYIRFVGFQPRGDMGQPRANRIQIPASDLKHQPTFYRLGYEGSHWWSDASYFKLVAASS